MAKRNGWLHAFPDLDGVLTIAVTEKEIDLRTEANQTGRFGGGAMHIFR